MLFIEAFDLVPRDKFWKVLQVNGVDGQLLRAIKSFYCRPEVCVLIGKQSNPLYVARVRFVTSAFLCLNELDQQILARKNWQGGGELLLKNGTILVTHTNQ